MPGPIDLLIMDFISKNITKPIQKSNKRKRLSRCRKARVFLDKLKDDKIITQQEFKIIESRADGSRVIINSLLVKEQITREECAELRYRDSHVGPECKRSFL